MRLRRSDLHRAGISRRRRGRSFTYLHADGSQVDAETRARISGLAIPPAWQDVWICPCPNGHIQAVGTDAAGRRQYLYHEQWRLAREQLKHNRGADSGPTPADGAADDRVGAGARRHLS